MSEWWLIILLLVITIFAITCIIYPLRRNRFISILLAPILFSLVATGYYFWGGFPQWQHYLHQNESQKMAQQLLKSIKTPQELIAKLRAKLDETPKSAKGWYLLGRLYTSQNDNQQATEAFAKAHRFQPDNEQYTVNYAHGLWKMNNQQFNPQIIGIFKSLLQKNPDQADALAMLAMNAFMSHAYEDAIDYWQHLLKLAPEQSEESLAIRKAIAKAQALITTNKKGT